STSSVVSSSGSPGRAGNSRFTSSTRTVSRPSRRRSPSASSRRPPPSHDPVHDAPKQQIRQDPDRRDDDQPLGGPDGVQHEKLIEQIERDGGDEEAARVAPSVPNQVPAVPAAGREDRPEVRRPAGTDVAEARADRKDGDDQRLKDQAEFHRSAAAAEKLLPGLEHVVSDVFHRETPPTRV